MRKQAKRRFPQLYAKQKCLQIYAKPFAAPMTLTGKLQANGLQIANIQTASDFIECHNYCRFKVYLRPFLISPQGKDFIAGSRFEDALQLHDFDQEFRSFVPSLTSEVELQLRHRLDQRLTAYGNDPFWYLKRQYYRDFPTKTLRTARSMWENSREEFAIHHAAKYHNGLGGEFNFLPPFWIVSELLTIGQLAHLLKQLEKPAFDNPASGANELDLLARDFGAYNIAQLQKWVEYVRNLRNWCAHHSRLWNRNMATPPNVARSLSKSIRPPGQNRLYHNLAMLRLMMKSRGKADNIKPTLKMLFARFPVADAHKDKMGFPHHWADDPFW